MLFYVCATTPTRGWADGTSLVALGKRLFFSTELSEDRTLACSSCHQPQKAFTDGRSTALGIQRRLGTRNTPSLLVAGSESELFWDGRRSSLESLVLDPVTSPNEMGLSDDEELLGRVRTTEFSDAFARAFPNDRTPITTEHVRSALAAFIRSLSMRRSEFDLYRGDPLKNPLNPLARRGLELFQNKAGCAVCHTLDGTPVLLSDGDYHHSSVGWKNIERDLPALTRSVLTQDLKNEALGRRVNENPQWAALGRFVVTHKATDLGDFRTPSLRNVAVTAPYMHDGSVATLADAVATEIYYRSLAAGVPLNLTADEQRALIAFLQALTDP